MVLVEQELGQLPALLRGVVAAGHLSQGGDLFGQFALSLVLLVQVLSGQIVGQMVVVLVSLADLDQVTDAERDFLLLLQGVLQSGQSGGGGRDLVAIVPRDTKSASASTRATRRPR